MENDPLKQGFAQMGETQSWLSYRLNKYENQWAAGKRLPCEYFFLSNWKNKRCCSIFWISLPFFHQDLAHSLHISTKNETGDGKAFTTF